MSFNPKTSKILDPECAKLSGLALQLSAFYYENRNERYDYVDGAKVLTGVTVFTSYHHPEPDAVFYALGLTIEDEF